MVIVGQVYIMSIIICFNILLMNLIIAILSNTYSRFESGSTGLYLSKILTSRDEVSYDTCYGSFLSAMPPINAIQFPFFPLAMSLRYMTPSLITFNEYIMIAQYCIFMIIFKVVFIITAQLLIPFAWIIGIFDKLRTLNDNYGREKLLNNICFIVLGPIILELDFIADCYWFWKNNFRTELKVIIIPKDKSLISHNSIREYLSICEKYINNKIKSANTGQIIKIFRKRFLVQENIQFLIYGQFIDFKEKDKDGNNRSTTYKSMRTNDLKEVRNQEIESLDDTAQFALSKDQLQQFNQLKKILINYSFKDRNKMILSQEVNWDVIDEMRLERKINLVLKDVGVDAYIFMDMPEVDLNNKESHK